jgi:hypothetical protein
MVAVGDVLAPMMTGTWGGAHGGKDRLEGNASIRGPLSDPILLRRNPYNTPTREAGRRINRPRL